MCEMRNISVTLCTVSMMNENSFKLMLTVWPLKDREVNPFLSVWLSVGLEIKTWECGLLFSWETIRQVKMPSSVSFKPVHLTSLWADSMKWAGRQMLPLPQEAQTQINNRAAGGTVRLARYHAPQGSAYGWQELILCFSTHFSLMCHHNPNFGQNDSPNIFTVLEEWSHY